MKIFKFDKHRLTYEEHPRKYLIYALYGVIVTAIGSIFAIIMFFFYSYFFPSEKIKDKKRQIDEYATTKQLLKKRIDSIQKDLDKLKQTEQKIQKVFLKQEEKEKKIKTTEKNDDLDQLTTKAINSKSELVKLISSLLAKKENIPYIPFGAPIQGKIICGFGEKNDPLENKKTFHKGIDIAAPVGTPIYATANGKVTFTGTKNMRTGLMIEIKHKNLFRTKYLHLSKIIVKKGQKVKKGDLIAYSGNTGIVKAAHLHYEVLKENEKHYDPLIFVFLGKKMKKTFSELYTQTNKCKEPLD